MLTRILLGYMVINLLTEGYYTEVCNITNNLINCRNGCCTDDCCDDTTRFTSSSSDQDNGSAFWTIAGIVILFCLLLVTVKYKHKQKHRQQKQLLKLLQQQQQPQQQPQNPQQPIPQMQPQPLQQLQFTQQQVQQQQQQYLYLQNQHQHQQQHQQQHNHQQQYPSNSGASAGSNISTIAQPQNVAVSPLQTRLYNTGPQTKRLASRIKHCQQSQSASDNDSKSCSPPASRQHLHSPNMRPLSRTILAGSDEC